MKYLLVSLILSSLLISPAYSFAKGPDDAPRAGDRLVAQNEGRDNVCEALQTRIDVRQRNFNSHRLGLLRRFDNLLERLENLVDKAQEFGLDTTELETQMVGLRERLGELSAEYQAFIDLLQVARAISCEEDPEGYQAAMAEARTQLVLVHEMAQDINTHYVNVIKPILLDLREQLSVLMEEENE